MSKLVMFMMFIWLFVVVAANVMQGQVDFVRTHLTANISDSGTTITVYSTEGFPNTGILVIEDEHIAYNSKTATTFKGNFAKPLIRGAEGTDAEAHVSGRQVTTEAGAMLNSSAAYNIAVMSDSSGLIAFVSMPLAFFSLLGSFIFLPLHFLGSDLQVLTFLWAIVGVGLLAAIMVQIGSGRRV